MNEKSQERIRRACYHLALLRVQDLDTGKWTDEWRCADEDCGQPVWLLKECFISGMEHDS